MEAGVGGGMTLASGGLAAPLGWPVMAHGFDHFFTGIQTAISGRLKDVVPKIFNVIFSILTLTIIY